jgi:chromosome segregation ATPase
MAVGDLEGKIGEVNGQLRMLTPILDELGKKVSGIAERLSAQAQSLKQVWHEIEELKKAKNEEKKEGSGRVWQVVLTVASAVIGALVTLGITKLTKGGP